MAPLALGGSEQCIQCVQYASVPVVDKGKPSDDCTSHGQVQDKCPSFVRGLLQASSVASPLFNLVLNFVKVESMLLLT